MSNVIELKQFNGMTVTPNDDAIMYDVMFGENGLISGCDVTYLGSNQIQIAAGRGIIKGRQWVSQQTTINVTLAESGELNGRIYIHMNLADTESPIKIMHETAETLSDLTQDENCNTTNGIYEIELATYTASVLTVSNLKKTATEVGGLYRKMVVDDRDSAIAVTENGIPVGCKAFAELANDTGTWIGSTTVESGSTSAVIENAAITANSLVDVYYAEASKETVASAGVTYSLAAGSLTLTFGSALGAAVTISNIKVVNV